VWRGSVGSCVACVPACGGVVSGTSPCRQTTTAFRLVWAASDAVHRRLLRQVRAPVVGALLGLALSGLFLIGRGRSSVGEHLLCKQGVVGSNPTVSMYGSSGDVMVSWFGFG
jgi:hypothetical protein